MLVHLEAYGAKVPSLTAEEFEDASRKTLFNRGADPMTVNFMNRTDVFNRLLALEGWDKVRRTYCEFVNCQKTRYDRSHLVLTRVLLPEFHPRIRQGCIWGSSAKGF